MGERIALLERERSNDRLRPAIVSLLTHTASIKLGEPSASVSLQTGDRVGPYVVEHRLGRGGMGEVYLARDSRLDRSVALKCLLSSDSGPELRDRIVREARLAARISHANVATVHDVIEQDDRTFIVMEYVEGDTLAKVLRRESMPESRVLQIARQLASALVAAHAVGVIHRDLKPANIQITTQGSAKILDFGIATPYASAVATTATGTTQVEGMTALAGTLGYMAPEQLLGHPVDERSDIFSLSAVLYEMCTGRIAFDVRDPLDNLIAIIRGAPRADGTGRPVTERVADVIARGLESNPALRYQSAAEMLTAIEAIPSPTHVAASQPRRYVSAIVATMCVPLAIWMFGWMSCAAYNLTFERTGAFAAESAYTYFEWGVKSLVAPSVYAALAALTYWSAMFLLNVAAIWPPASRLRTAARVALRALAERLGLNDPVNLAHGLASAGLLTLLLMVWWFNPLIRAWGGSASTGDLASLQPLDSANVSTKVMYRFLLTVLLVGFSASLIGVVHMRQRLAMSRGRGSVTALATIVVCFVLLNEVPYRIMWGKSYRVDYLGAPCYNIGESDLEYLLYCPRAPVPRNRVVKKNAPLSQTNLYENVFTSPR
jgi:predicted Ser/Thr protein kinase